jgi:type VII secretion protein EccE
VNNVFGRDLTRLVVIAVIFILALFGWAVGGYVGAAGGLIVGLVLGVAPWKGQPLWSWLGLYLRRNRPILLAEPATVANDRSGGGVRYQDDIAVAAVQILGKPYQPNLFTGSTATVTANEFDIAGLLPAMRQSLGLTLESLSVISAGARRRPSGDYPRVYDTLIGTPPYAGQRETWLVIRIRAMDNGDALRWRPTAGTAALAAAQRIAMTFRCRGIRAKVATAADIVELERRLGNTALEPHNGRWNSVRSDAGWLTTYAYRPGDITTEALAQAWALRVDGIIQNVTLFPDRAASATVTVRTAQPPTASPAVSLAALPGEQSQAIAANLCGPRPQLRGVSKGPLPQTVVVPVGPSGVLLGKTAGGDRLAMPLNDPGEQTRVHIAADDAIAKRIIIRAAASGDRITVHTTNLQRWETVRMPHIAVIENPRPASGTTLSVIDGTVPPAPRPHTVISVGARESAVNAVADVVITQNGPDTVEVTAAGHSYDVAVEFFRAENLYVSWQRGGLRTVDGELEMVD